MTAIQLSPVVFVPIRRIRQIRARLFNPDGERLVDVRVAE
jgi:hypothetical protein